MDNEEQIANLLLLMGPDSVPIFNQFTFHATATGRTRTLNNVIGMFDKHFEPVKNIIYERVQFNNIRQGDLNIHQFITQVQSQADHCDYGEMRDQLVRDRIVVGVNDSKLREQLVDIENLDLNTCIRKAKQFTSHHMQARQIATDAADANMDVLRDSDKKRYSEGRRQFQESERVGPPPKKCYFCNKVFHRRDRCPARDKFCFVCKEKGHWSKSKACKGPSQGKKVEEVNQELEGLFLGSDSD